MVASFFADSDFQVVILFFDDGPPFCWSILSDGRAFLMVTTLFDGGSFFAGRDIRLVRAFFYGCALFCSVALSGGRPLF